VNILDEIMPEAGSFYVMDRGFLDFQRLFVFTLSSAFFVVRTKSNVLIQRRYSHPADKSTGVRSDQTVILTSFESASAYPDAGAGWATGTGSWLKRHGIGELATGAIFNHSKSTSGENFWLRLSKSRRFARLWYSGQTYRLRRATCEK
jgi:hypothetical protein